MRKTFNIIVENKKPDRQVDSIKYEVKKYIARERRKKLADGIDYWDFDCRIGLEKDSAVSVHVADINKAISKIAAEQQPTFYLEVLAKPGIRKKRSESGQASVEQG